MAKRAAVTYSYLLARRSFVCEVDGKRLSFHTGDPIEAEHPAVAKYPDLFGPPIFHYRIEQATAAPGEKRGE